MDFERIFSYLDSPHHPGVCLCELGANCYSLHTFSCMGTHSGAGKCVQCSCGCRRKSAHTLTQFILRGQLRIPHFLQNCGTFQYNNNKYHNFERKLSS